MCAYVCVWARQRASTLNKGFNSHGHRRSDHFAAGEWRRASFPAKFFDAPVNYSQLHYNYYHLYRLTPVVRVQNIKYSIYIPIYSGNKYFK